MDTEIRAIYDWRIFIECPAALCIERAIQQDLALGGDITIAPLLWKEVYAPREQEYIETQKPQEHANTVAHGE